MGGRTPMQKYYDTHSLCTHCGYEYNRCICKDDIEQEDYANMALQQLEREV